MSPCVAVFLTLGSATLYKIINSDRWQLTIARHTLQRFATLSSLSLLYRANEENRLTICFTEVVEAIIVLILDVVFKGSERACRGPITETMQRRHRARVSWMMRLGLNNSAYVAKEIELREYCGYRKISTFRFCVSLSRQVDYVMIPH